MNGSPSDLVITRPSTFIVAQETLLFQLVASERGTRSHSLTMMYPTNLFFNSWMHSARISVSFMKQTSRRMMLEAGVCDSQLYSPGVKTEPRSKSPKSILPAGVSSSNITTIAARSTPPPPVSHLDIRITASREKNGKLQALKAKFARHVQIRKEAASRATKAARLLRNTWTHDARYRRGMKAKRQAERQVRASTYVLEAICQEELGILSK